MTQAQEQKKKRRRQLSAMQQVQEEVAVQNATEVMEALQELEKEGVHIDIQVCPRCKSPRVKRAESTGGDTWAHIGMANPSYTCLDCGWQERIVLKATNKRMTVKEVELIREAMDLEDGHR